MNALTHSRSAAVKRLLTYLAVSGFVWFSGVNAEEPGKTPASAAAKPTPITVPPRAAAKPNPELPVLQKVGPGVFRLGEVLINKNAKSLSLPAVVNMNKGLLEYVLVRNGGKMHESLLRTSVDPMHIQLGLLLIGAEGTDQPLARQGDPGAPRGNPVEIVVSTMKNGRMAPLFPETWITQRAGDKSGDSAPLHWVFTGSHVFNGRLLAQVEGSIIAIYHDPAALFDNASPGGESDRIWFVKEGAPPPVGTPVTVTISIKP